MPKSKRAKAVALTQTDRKVNREHKSAFIEEVRNAVDGHDRLYLFSYENMRSSKFKDIRMHFREQKKQSKNDGMDDGDDDTTSTGPSRIFIGKNKLVQIALGRVPEDEYSDNLRHVSKLVTGPNIGLLLTSRSRKDVETFFANFVEPDYCKAGFISPKTIMITNDMLSSFPVSMVEQLRKLGLPNEVDNGKVVLSDGRKEFRLCKEGETLSAEKCKLLVHFGFKLAAFKVKLLCHWQGGEFEMMD